ncbi:type II secretion system F family protein [Methyloterricola oryzae]|uniref:type II secretion system F family protein n=1 Tax=Methyloterricola oryzae TaxID=1495050 RepID=UPI0005EB5064|nr:type II secretion system F family protein [Methyloterricola oryzae]
MDRDTLIIFLLMVFGAVFLLTQSIVVPTFGTSGRESRRLRNRLGAIADARQTDNQISLMRSKYLKKLSPLEKRLEALPGMQRLETFIERSGHAFPGYRLVLICVMLAAAAGFASWHIIHSGFAVVASSAMAGWLPLLTLKADRSRRFALFEEQLPDALDIMTRALRAGYPFNETLNLVATEMEAPIAPEFRMAFEEINFGVEMRWALHNLVDRMPSLSLMAIVTTVLVQRETGGNLAETFENIGRLIRGRFRFHRRVRTLTAEARMSAWILAMVPFLMFAGMSILSSDYVMTLVQTPMGHKLVFTGLGLLILGNLWIRRLISIDV